MATDVEIRHPPNDPKGKYFTVGMVQDVYRIQTNRYGDVCVPVYDSRIFDYMTYRIKHRAATLHDNRIVIAGPPRSGKTTIANTWARKIDPDFPVENVAFRLSDFRQTLASLPPADPSAGIFPIAILDESGVDLYSKDWARRVVKEMVKVFQIVGKKRLTMIMCLPHLRLLTKDMRDAMHFWVNTKELDEQRGFAELREAVANPWAEPYWNPICGFMFEQMTGPFWSKYEKLKDEFIERFVTDEPATASHREERLMNQRDICIKELRRNHTTREIETLIALDQAAVVRIGQK